MQNVLSVIEEVIPDIMYKLQNRYQILRNVFLLGPVGRRVVSERMGITERVLRTESEGLKKQGLIKTSKMGMELTEKGEAVYHQLDQLMGQLLGMKEKEKKLASYLEIEHCVIISGDVDEQSKLHEEMGRAAVEALDFLLPEGTNIIAVMGGTTMAEVANQMNETLSRKRKLMFVPARGGLGESVDIQANSISALMAQKTGGENRVLYVPEQVSVETYKPLLQEPGIKKTLKLVDDANCVLYGIGDAKLMAERRGMNEEVLALIETKAAVGEAYGEFYNQSGGVVYKIPRIGLQSDKLADIASVMVVAGGKSKAKAIEAHIKKAPRHTWLITDEGAANEILTGITL
ncbi:sugar-binding domain-containing protein [Carnobacterium viridans]|uniref:Central glycolytic genes regulator n=1 Tax=Carnobacterium viridans TaxID=174587 RepID=A0A1H1APM2_9LACT|nr:sugar-binding domain-containing protein [Carnobacterium viridans]UDE96106.1 sugar-binding domain-containing protein [Carnobacterium viridans]SDQ41665.1 central glycolytic genes regulator [Carnobacterium viridans]